MPLPLFKKKGGGGEAVLNYAKHIVNQFVLLHLRSCSDRSTLVLVMLRYYNNTSKRDDATFVEHASWKFVPLGGKTGKKFGAQIDINNTLSMSSLVNIFSQLLLYLLWMIDTFHLQLYMLCSMAEVDRYLYFHQ